MITLTREEAQQVLDWIDRNGEVVFAGGGLSAVLSMNLVAETLRAKLSESEIQLGITYEEANQKHEQSNEKS